MHIEYKTVTGQERSDKEKIEKNVISGVF